MNRQEQIDQAWFFKACQSTHCYDEKSFKEAVEWADNHPDKNKVYTKQELRDMGFGFDLNGNIETPKECYKRAKKYTEYRKKKLIDKACEYLSENLYEVASGVRSLPCIMSVEIITADEFLQKFREALKG